MTAAQKAARVKFNKAIAIRKKTGCTLKEAFAQVYGKKVSAAPKKTAKKIGALPIGFKGKIFDIDFKIVNQYDIYGDVSAIMEDTNNGKTITIFDGKGSAKDKAQSIVNYINKITKQNYDNVNNFNSKMLKFATNMQKEVKDFNAGKKKTIKKQPLIIKEPKEVKKVAPKKSAPKKKVSKPHTKWGKVHAHERRVAGLKKRKAITEKAILNKIHKVKKDVDTLDEAQHKHMMGGRLSLSQQIGKIKMGSTFIYYKGFSIERMELTIKDKKKKLPVFIVHELNQTFRTLSDAKRMIDFLAR